MCDPFLSQEYSRLVLSLSDAWRISRVNQNFEVCPTYPRLVLVPKPVDDDSILKIAKFRQRARFPVLAYFHKPTQMVLLRSSQVSVKLCKRIRCFPFYWAAVPRGDEVL